MASIDERIKAQEEKLKQLKALHQKQQAQKRAAEVKKLRADETRRKILVGSMYLQGFGVDDERTKKMISQLDKFLKRADDRALFDLPPLPDQADENANQQ